MSGLTPQVFCRYLNVNFVFALAYPYRYCVVCCYWNYSSFGCSLTHAPEPLKIR